MVRKRTESTDDSPSESAYGYGIVGMLPGRRRQRDFMRCSRPCLTSERAMVALPYICHLLNAKGLPSEAVILNCASDADALLAGHLLKQARAGCVGYEIRRAGELIYRHEFNPLRAVGQTKCRTIMLVEDDVLFRSAAARHLRDEGFRVVELSGSLAAMMAFDGPVSIDLLLADVELRPGTPHGIALARMVQFRLPRLPIILVTGYPERQDGQADPAWRTLLKPVAFRVLAEAVRAELERSIG